MRILFGCTLLAVSIFTTQPTLAQDMASRSGLANVAFSEVAWDWNSEDLEYKRTAVEAAASSFGRSCGDSEFYAFQTSGPDAVAEATMDNFRKAGWDVEERSGQEGTLHYRAALEGAELAIAWIGVDSGVALFLCKAIPVTDAGEVAHAGATDVAGSQTAATDDRDAVDFSDSKYLIAAILAGIGFCILGFGIYIRRRASQSASWPQAVGTVLSSGLGYEFGKDADGDDYELWWPKIQYSYSVSGNGYEGNRVRFGNVKMGEESKAQALLSAYPQGSPVMVRYNPKNHEDATLEVVKPGLGTSIVIAGVFFVLAVVCLTAV